MLEALRGDGDEDSAAKLAALLDQLVQKLVAEGYLKADQPPPQMPGAQQPVTGKGSVGHAASKDVQFNLTDKGLDFLGYKTLRGLLGSLGKSSVGSHDTPYLATGVESDGFSKPYEFGDVLNLDVNETLRNSLARTGQDRGADGPRLPGPDGAPGRVPLELRDGADARHVALDDPLRRGPLHAGEEGGARARPPHPHAVPRRHGARGALPRLGRGDPARAARARAGGPYHTNTAEGLKLARRILMAQKKDMRQIVMITDGKPSALTLPNGMIYKNPMGLDAGVLGETLRRSPTAAGRGS
jgi:Ca-activated chloride channel family protein